MRLGKLSIEVVCTDEWLSAKSAPGAGRGAPQALGGGRGGLAARGRGMPMPGVGRGRGAPGMMAAGRGRGMLPGMAAGRGAPRPGMPGRPPAPVSAPAS